MTGYGSWLGRLQFVGIAIREPGYHVWGCSPVRGEDGRIHVFAARWPVAKGFVPGWYQDSEIARYVGSQPEGPFAFAEVVIPARGDRGWNRVSAHNPTIRRVGDRFALCYISNAGVVRGVQ